MFFRLCPRPKPYVKSSPFFCGFFRIVWKNKTSILIRNKHCLFWTHILKETQEFWRKQLIKIEVTSQSDDFAIQINWFEFVYNAFQRTAIYLKVSTSASWKQHVSQINCFFGVVNDFNQWTLDGASNFISHHSQMRTPVDTPLQTQSMVLKKLKIAKSQKPWYFSFIVWKTTHNYCLQTGENLRYF